MQSFVKTPSSAGKLGQDSKDTASRPAQSRTSPLHLMQKRFGNQAVGQFLRAAIAQAATKQQESPASDVPVSDVEVEQKLPQKDDDAAAEIAPRKQGRQAANKETDVAETAPQQREETLDPQQVKPDQAATEQEPRGRAAAMTDAPFVSFTKSTASEIAVHVADLGADVTQQFATDRTTWTANAPSLRVSLPGDSQPSAAPKAAAPEAGPLPTADRIALQPPSSEEPLSAQETEVPLQPDGDAVGTSAGAVPQLRLVGDVDPAQLQAVAGRSRSIGQDVNQQIGQEIIDLAGSATIQRVGVDREEKITLPEASTAPAIRASEEMREYITTDVPSNVRSMADADFSPLLEASLAGPRQQVQDANEQRDIERDRVFRESLKEAETASLEARNEQQQAVDEGYAQVQAEKQKGLDEGRQKVDEFDAEVSQRHAAQDEQIRTKVSEEQEKADKEVQSGEEKALQAEQDAKAEEQRQREEAERNKPEKPKKKWYQKVGDWFKNAINKWTDELVKVVKQVFDSAKKVVSNILTAAKSVAVKIIRGLKNAVVGMIQTFATGLKLLVNALLVAFPKLRERVNKAIDGAVEAAVTIVNYVAQKLEDTVTYLVDKVESTITRIMDVCELVIVTQIQIVGALLTGDFLNAAKILFLAACKAVGIPGEAFLDILADAGDALLDIMKRPAKFLGYLLKSVGQGMGAFFSNFPQRMVGGLTGWLFGQMATGGITLPKSFDLKSIFMLIVQLMGFTYDYIRAGVVRLVGEKAVSVIEQVMTPIKILFTEGPGALWQWLADQADQVKTAIVQAASQWLVTQIITQAAIKLASMFTPVGAFVQAVLMMYNTVMFFVEKINEIFAWVKSVTSSLKTIAVGAIGAAASYIDQSMSKSIPLIIAFLARLLGVDGIGDKIREVVTKLRTPVDKAINFLVGKLITGAKAAWGGIKAGAKAAKDAIVNWWNSRADFVTREGEHHTFYFADPSSTTLYLASEDGKPAKPELKKRLETSDKDTKAGISETLTSVEKAESEAANAKQESDSKIPNKNAKRVQSAVDDAATKGARYIHFHSAPGDVLTTNPQSASAYIDNQAQSVTYLFCANEGFQVSSTAGEFFVGIGMVDFGKSESTPANLNVYSSYAEAMKVAAPRRHAYFKFKGIILPTSINPATAPAMTAAMREAKHQFAESQATLFEAVLPDVITMAAIKIAARVFRKISKLSKLGKGRLEGKGSEIPSRELLEGTEHQTIPEADPGTGFKGGTGTKVTSNAVLHRYSSDEIQDLINFWENEAKTATSDARRKRYESYKKNLETLKSDPDAIGKIPHEQSEREVQYLYREIGGDKKERVFRNGQPIGHRRGVGGSTRPDASLGELMVEVKSYQLIRKGEVDHGSILEMLEGGAGKRNVPLSKQIAARKGIYSGSQSIVIDIRGQKATAEQANEIARAIASHLQFPIERIQVLH